MYLSFCSLLSGNICQYQFTFRDGIVRSFIVMIEFFQNRDNGKEFALDDIFEFKFNILLHFYSIFNVHSMGLKPLPKYVHHNTIISITHTLSYEIKSFLIRDTLFILWHINCSFIISINHIIDFSSKKESEWKVEMFNSKTIRFEIVCFIPIGIIGSDDSNDIRTHIVICPQFRNPLQLM